MAAPLPGGFLALAVLAGAAAYSKSRSTRKRRLREETYSPVPAEDPGLNQPVGPILPPPSGGCASWQPVIIAPFGTVGTWVDDGSGSCRLVCMDGWALSPDGKTCVRVQAPSPTPTPTPAPAPTPAPSPAIPAGQGPTGIGTCVEGFYNRDPMPAAGFALALTSSAKTLAEAQTYYLYPSVQGELFAAIRDRYMSSHRSVQSVVVRDVLTALRPACDWWRDNMSFSEVERLTFNSALDLAKVAEKQIGFTPGSSPNAQMFMKLPGGGPTPVILPRVYLELPPTNASGLVPDQRVEVLVGFFDPAAALASDRGLLYAENLIARVLTVDPTTGTFKVEIIPQFQGKDRTPKLNSIHHYNVGTKVKLNINSPTGIRRIYSQGTT